MRFRATLLLSGKTATGIQVPDEVVAGLGAGRKPAVKVTINGHTYRSSIASMGGRFMLPVSAEQRKNTGVAAGDEFDLNIVLDTEPRVVEVPADLAAALDQDAAAKEAFGRLAYSHQLRHVLAIEGAKAVDTRRRRVQQAIQMLGEAQA